MEGKRRLLELEYAGGYRFDITFSPDLDVLVADEPPPLGEGRGVDAASLLGAAVGNCLSASLLVCLKKSRVEVESLRSTVEVDITRNERGRFRVSGIDVRMQIGTDGDSEAKLDRCAALFEDFCVVTAAVRHGIPIEVEIADTSGRTYLAAQASV
jgi:uncharacterized OsmC-like protein